MNRKFLVWAGSLLAALLVVGAAGASVAYADDATPPAPPAGAPADGGGRHGGRGLPQAELEGAAKVLGMTTDELSTALQNGQTLEDLATKAGVDVTAVQNAIKAA